jgi:hypothetical protein
MDDIQSPNYVALGYGKGVPMGGDLAKAPRGKAPTFLIHAAKDPIGANLDRVQVVKGWMDKKGDLHEKIYNVALSDNRKTGKDGKAPAVGNTVDVKTATYKNSIGDPELAAVWTDPDFNMQNFLGPKYPKEYQLPSRNVLTLRLFGTHLNHL